MSNEEGERKPPSAADVLRWQQEDIARRQARKSKTPKPKIDEHLDLGKTIAEERRRKRRHPAGHGRRGLPTGFSTAGSASQESGSKSVE